MWNDESLPSSQPTLQMKPSTHKIIPLIVCSAIGAGAVQASTITMALHLDASDFTSAGSISSWADKSGNNRDATAFSNPTVVLNGLNSMAVVNFDGNDYFRIQSTYTTGTAFIVTKYDGTVWGTHDGLYGAATGNGASEQYFTGSGNGSGTNWSNEAGGGFYNSKWRNGVQTESALTDPAAFNLYSGVDATPNSFAEWTLGDDRGFGGGRGWNGDIAEVIVYEEALSDFDRKGVEVYLDEKWGLGQNLRATYGNGNFNNDLVSLSVASVPEPSSLALLGIGSSAMLIRRRK